MRSDTGWRRSTPARVEYPRVAYARRAPSAQAPPHRENGEISPRAMRRAIRMLERGQPPPSRVLRAAANRGDSKVNPVPPVRDPDWATRTIPQHRVDSVAPAVPQ